MIDNPYLLRPKAPTMNRIYLIAALAVALLISLGINLHQFVARRVDDATAPLQQEIVMHQRTEAISSAVAKARATDGIELERLRKQVATQGERTVTVYRDRIKTLPAPSCAPGHDRVSAWNSIAPESTR